MTLRATSVRARALACTCAQGPRARSPLRAPLPERAAGGPALRLGPEATAEVQVPRVQIDSLYPPPSEQASRPLSRLLLRPPSRRAKCRLSPSPRRSVGSWKVTPGTVPDLRPDPSRKSLQCWAEGEKGDTRALALQLYHSPNTSSRLLESSISPLSPKPVSHPPTSGCLPLP